MKEPFLDPTDPGLAAVGDNALVQLATQNTEVFSELYKRHAERVYRYLLAKVGDPDNAQDLTAETFLAALKGIRSYRNQGDFLAWLLGIARHKAMDYFRRKRDIVPLESVTHLQHPDLSPEDTTIEHLQISRLWQAMHKLSHERAEALTLRVFVKLSAAEAGRIMGKSETAVRMLVYRAIQDLQVQLQDQETEGGSHDE